MFLYKLFLQPQRRTAKLAGGCKQIPPAAVASTALVPSGTPRSSVCSGSGERPGGEQARSLKVSSILHVFDVFVFQLAAFSMFSMF
jgi:hypothetical protein